jgi:hypothetical protein
MSEDEGGTMAEEPTYQLVDRNAEAGPADTITDRVNPARLANEIIPIRDAFVRVLSQAYTSGAFALQSVEVSLALTADGSIGFVKGFAQGSITLTFQRP